MKNTSFYILSLRKLIGSWESMPTKHIRTPLPSPEALERSIQEILHLEYKMVFWIFLREYTHFMSPRPAHQTWSQIRSWTPWTFGKTLTIQSLCLHSIQQSIASCMPLVYQHSTAGCTWLSTEEASKTKDSRRQFRMVLPMPNSFSLARQNFHLFCSFLLFVLAWLL